eukprot:998876_1
MSNLSEKATTIFPVKMESSSKGLACGKCGNQYKYAFRLAKHVCPVDLLGVQNFDYNTHIACIKCGERPTHDDNLTNHKCRNSTGFQCTRCDKKCMSFGSLNKHIQCVHLNLKPFQCPHCSKRFFKRPGLTCHLTVHSDTRDFPCEMCGKYFKTKKSVEKHKIHVHFGIKRFQCNICSKRFSTSVGLTRHHRVHKMLSDVVSKCSFCGKNVKYLAQHLKIHSKQEKTYACDKCPKQFAFMNYLTKHKKRHLSVSEANSFVCEVCGKKLLNQSRTAHMLIHSGTKDYECLQCGKKFRDKATLEQHIRVHTGVKPYGCNMCEKRFSHRTSLVYHRKSHEAKKVLYIN